MSAAKELSDLVQQSVIVSTMMLTVLKNMHDDYGTKHPGAVFEELIVAFVLWREDTMLHPKSVNEIARECGIPPTNVRRIVAALCTVGILTEPSHRRYARNPDYLAARLKSVQYKNIRKAIVTAGAGLRKIYKVK
jgi:hypothetical protein